MPLLPAWQLDPSVVAGIVLGLLAYLLLWWRSVGDRRRAAWPWPQVLSYLAGVGSVVLALLSPLDALADNLFAAHMLQHMLLLVVAPPLLLLGLPVKAILRNMPRPLRHRVLRPLARSRLLHRLGAALFHPITVFCLFNGVLALWHVPSVYDAAQRVEPLHIVEHLSYLFVGCLLWWVIVEPLRVWPREAELGKIAFVTVCHLPMLLLGQVFLAFVGVPLYTFGAAGEAAWGLTPLTDQRVGGGIMFGLDLLIAFVTISVLLTRYLAALERRQLALDELLAARR